MRNEVEQARADGGLWNLQRNYAVPEKAGSAGGKSKTRDQVRQELLKMSEAEERDLREVYGDGQ